MPGPKVTFRLQTKYRVELETHEKVQRDSHEFIHQVFYSLILKQKQQVCFLYWHNRLIPRVFWVFPPVCGCKHFSHHAPWFCLSVSVTNMLSYTQYHCHLVPRAFLASSAGAVKTLPPPPSPSSLMNDLSCRFIVGLVFPGDDTWQELCGVCRQIAKVLVGQTLLSIVLKKKKKWWSQSQIE